MGVAYDLFWELNPRTLAPFVKAFDLEQIQKDREAWVQGQYFQIAVVSALNAKVHYPKKPRLEEQRILEDPVERMKLIKQRFWRHAQLLNTKVRRSIINE